MSEFVVVTDLHGRLEHLRQIQTAYPGVQLISGGDVVDGPEYSNVAETIELLLEMGAICLSGNHDWVTSVSLKAPDNEVKDTWISDIWSRNHFNTLGSYGIKNFDLYHRVADDEMHKRLEQLKKALQKTGHQEYFDNLVPYFDSGNFIVVHAGFEFGRSLAEQKTELDSYFTLGAGITCFDLAPIQIFDDEYALSGSEVGLEGDSKVLITGHNHRTDYDRRLTNNGKRIRLASRYNDPNSPIYAWESWSGKVVPILPRS